MSKIGNMIADVQPQVQRLQILVPTCNTFGNEPFSLDLSAVAFMAIEGMEVGLGKEKLKGIHMPLMSKSVSGQQPTPPQIDAPFTGTSTRKGKEIS